MEAQKNQTFPRDSIWVTSKLWPNEYGEEVTPKQLDKMLERLGVEYLDLVYLYQPLRNQPIRSFSAGICSAAPSPFPVPAMPPTSPRTTTSSTSNRLPTRCSASTPWNATTALHHTKSGKRHFDA